jgi:glycosyltransferase involved in cell wall biosynthesis
MLVLMIVLFTSLFIIFWAMIGYPLSLKIIGQLLKSKKIVKNYEHQPSVTVMVVAHNEEKVIHDKLLNIISLDYPASKIKYMVSSDHSTDRTNEIVKEFIQTHLEYDITLFEVKQRKGKTNAQNEAQKFVDTEFLVMTDANSMLDAQAIKELMAAFSSQDIAYVSGRLSIVNVDVSDVSHAESNYWDSEMITREIEGRIFTITAGNGALYACRNAEYFDFDPIESHDSAMPIHYALKGMRAIANHDAIAYEKAGEVIEDEFGRKVRMNRVLLRHILPDLRILNVFKYGWFTYFYLGHRTCRYLLWISHLILFISSLLLSTTSWIFALMFLGQVMFYILALLKAATKTQNKYLTLVYYYTVTIVAQWVGVYRTITGKSKPFWEKAESTR